MNEILAFFLRYHHTAVIDEILIFFRYHHTAVIHGECMYVFGGYASADSSSVNASMTNRNDLYEYKFSAGVWTQIRFSENSPVPPPRSAHGAVIWEGRPNRFLNRLNKKALQLFL